MLVLAKYGHISSGPCHYLRNQNQEKQYDEVGDIVGIGQEIHEDYHERSINLVFTPAQEVDKVVCENRLYLHYGSCQGSKSEEMNGR